ncbi:MAG: 50S ribosomal protein L4 [Methylacidiphilales bacterium]|nr:50S ribosomal protein L4 [Candidatus Methylacidiphilales bacterium]
MDITVLGTKNIISFSDELMKTTLNNSLVHQVVTSYLGIQRAGSAKQKNRSEVRGGGIKPWKQKGTGRARAGSIRSPLWRKGGVTFAARGKRSYGGKINKTMYRLAIKQLLISKIQKGNIFIVEELNFQKPSTKDFIQKFNLFKIPLVSTVIILDPNNHNAHLSSRNIPRVYTCSAQDLNPYILLKYDHFVFEKTIFEQLQYLQNDEK